MTTDDIHATLKSQARNRGYTIKHWLKPTDTGDELKVVARMTIKGKSYGRGFRWDGKNIKDLYDRAVALDYSMGVMERLVSEGKLANGVEVMH